MAAITLAAVRQTEHIRDQLTAALATFHAMLDAFARNRLRPRRSTFDCGNSPDHSEVPAAQFEPLDSTIISNSIPAFFVGRNEAGLWVAREAKGRIGGIFCSGVLRCPLHMPKVLRQAVQQYSRPRDSNLISKTREIRLQPVLLR
jgi:hypothetical protein